MTREHSGNLREAQRLAGVAGDLAQHLVFERLLFDLSTQFIVVRLTAEELGYAIEAALSRLNDWLGVDGSAIGQLIVEGQRSEVQFRSGEPLEVLAHLPEEMPASYRHILSGNDIVAALEGAPHQQELHAAIERAGFEHAIVVPLSSEGCRVTFLACWWRAHSQLSGEQVDQLRMIGELTMAALQRQEAEARQLELEEKLQQARKLQSIGLLASGVAHDFNNILTVIESSAEYALLRIPPGDTELWEALSEVITGVKHAGDLTQKLLAFGRRQVAPRRLIDLSDMVRALERILRRLVKKSVDIEIEASREACTISAAPVELDQIIMNLIVNSNDAMPDGGSLKLATRRVVRAERNGQGEREYVELVVLDTGVGIGQEQRERIFDPFFTTKPVGKGTGLGLSVVHGIVSQYDGFVEVDSTPGVGTEVRVYVPYAEGIAPIISTYRPRANHPRGEVILLADDEQRVRELLSRMLVGAGYKTLCASDGAEAVELFHQHQHEIGMAVLDVIMPKLNGREAYERMAEHRPDMPVLFISGQAADVLPTQYFEHPLRDLLPKPYAANVLLARVGALLESSGARSSASSAG